MSAVMWCGKELSEAVASGTAAWLQSLGVICEGPRCQESEESSVTETATVAGDRTEYDGAVIALTTSDIAEVTDS